MGEHKEGIVVDNGQVVIFLGVDAAEWLLGELPQRDGFTRDLDRAITLAKRVQRMTVDFGGDVTPS